MNEVKVIPWSNFKCLTFYQQAGGGPSTERHSCLICIRIRNNERNLQIHDGIQDWQNE